MHATHLLRTKSRTGLYTSPNHRSNYTVPMAELGDGKGGSILNFFFLIFSKNSEIFIYFTILSFKPQGHCSPVDESAHMFGLLVLCLNRRIPFQPFFFLFSFCPTQSGHIEKPDRPNRPAAKEDPCLNRSPKVLFAYSAVSKTRVFNLKPQGPQCFTSLSSYLHLLPPQKPTLIPSTPQR